MSIKKIGITGPSGSGKSTLCDYLAARGIPTINADTVYHSMLVKDSPCTLALANEFGADILSPEGTPDRKRLGAIVFSSEERLEKLNEIVLKFVIDEINQMISVLEAEGHKSVMLDAPTLIESGFNKECDAVVSILAPISDRVCRICARDGITEEAALLRVKAQKPDEFYKKHSDMVIVNDSGEDALYLLADELMKTVFTVGVTDEQ